METLTIKLSEEVMADVNAAIAGRGVSAKDFAVSAVAVQARRERELAARERRQVQSGKWTPAEESDAAFRKKYSIPDDLFALTPDELADQSDAILASLSPEKLAELEREGVL